MMNRNDLEYLLDTLEYGLNNCNDNNGDTQTHYNSFANAIEIVKGLIKMNEHLRDINIFINKFK